VKRILPFAMLIAVLAFAGVAAAGKRTATTVVQANQSTFLMYRTDKTVCTNWGGYQFFHVGTNALSVRRGLVQFDLSSVPRYGYVRSAILSLYETDTLRGSGTVTVHRVTTPWAEGTGVNTCTNDGATWLSPWLSPGGDFASTPVASRVKQAGDTPGWDTFDVTSLVRGWTSGAYPNDGVLLKLADESFSACTTVTNCNYWGYASDEYRDPTLRPTLTIVYG
jgi:hypothetical protein